MYSEQRRPFKNFTVKTTIYLKMCRKLRRQLNIFTSRNKADDTLKFAHPHVGIFLDESLVLSLGEHANKKRAQHLRKDGR